MVKEYEADLAARGGHAQGETYSVTELLRRQNAIAGGEGGRGGKARCRLTGKILIKPNQKKRKREAP